MEKCTHYIIAEPIKRQHFRSKSIKRQRWKNQPLIAGHSHATNPHYSLSLLPFLFLHITMGECFWTAHCDLLVLAAWQRLNLIRRAKHCGPAFKIHLEQAGGGQSVSFISRICAVGALCYFRRQKRCEKWQKLGDCEVVALTSWTSTS